MKSLFDSVRDAVAAAAGAGAAGAGGVAVGAPGWLVGLGQAVIVVFFTLRGVDRRQRRMKDDIDELRGMVKTLTGRIGGLACQGGDDDEDTRRCA